MADYKYNLLTRVVFDGHHWTVVERFQGAENLYLIQRFEEGGLRKIKIDQMVNESDLRLPE